MVMGKSFVGAIWQASKQMHTIFVLGLQELPFHHALMALEQGSQLQLDLFCAKKQKEVVMEISVNMVHMGKQFEHLVQ